MYMYVFLYLLFKFYAYCFDLETYRVFSQQNLDETAFSIHSILFVCFLCDLVLMNGSSKILRQERNEKHQIRISPISR